MCRDAKQDYYCLKIEECGNDQKKVFNLANSLMNNKKDSSLPSICSSELSEKFADYFTDKIAKIRESFENNDNGLTSSEYSERNIPDLSVLSPTSELEIKKIIMEGNSKACDLDPIPTQLLKSCIDVLLPCICKIVNASLSSARVPSCLKSATVSPLLKKPSLNKEDMKNYRPVSNLPYISKLIEKVVVRRLNTHMNEHHLHDFFQSAYRAGHSTENALVRVHNDILQAIDRKQCVFLVLLDQSAAFDTIEHDVLLERMEHSVHVNGTALQWFRSYFDSRTQSVNILGSSSTARRLTSGMPQGSVVGPFGFPLYTGPVGEICRRHGVLYHCYADDTQLYVPFDLEREAEARIQLENCIDEIRHWMKQNYLKLNESKTEFLIFGSKHQHQKLSTSSIRVGDQSISASSAARNIGAVFDCQLTMKDHVANVCRACYFQLRSIGKVRRYLTLSASETLVHAFIASRVDHMNAILYGVPKCLLSKLQKVQNNAARIITRSKRRDHITPVLKRLHWLPVHCRIQYKILLLVFKALYGLAPGYLAELVEWYMPQRATRSQNAALLKPSLAKTVTFGERSFKFSAPKLWNKMPPGLRQSNDIDSFKANLKTHLFNTEYEL